jgi:hypothetical protein
MPNGAVATEELLYDGAKYYYDFLTPEIGRYTVTVSYSYPGFEAAEYTEYFNISYSPEYDRFVTFNSAVLNEAISSYGTVSENGVPKLQNNENEVATYKITFATAFMIICAVIFVLDVIIRKLTFKDILSLFGKGVKEEKRK